jgi:hypothetical protein
MTFNVSQANESARRFHRRRSADAAAKRKATMIARYGCMSNGAAAIYDKQIEMVVSPWFRDEQGFLTRTVRAA